MSSSRLFGMPPIFDRVDQCERTEIAGELATLFAPDAYDCAALTLMKSVCVLQKHRVDNIKAND
jgi:hypothetical protein